MKKKNISVRSITIIILSLVIVIGTSAAMTGCESIRSYFSTLKGNLLGNSYQIWEYDNFGNKILNLNGNKISLSAEVDEEGNPTSYISVTVDGYDWKHVGNSLVFCQDGVDMITDFKVPEEINSNGNSTGLIPFDRVINKYKNQFGKECVVIVYSQTGAPICMFQGDSCYFEVPTELPKTTKLSIDGKLVYIHRAQIDIIPTELFNQ